MTGELRGNYEIARHFPIIAYFKIDFTYGFCYGFPKLSQL